MLNSLFLVEKELLPLPILYLSRFIIANKAQYYDLLLQVTRAEAWEPWLIFMLRGVAETATWTTRKINAIRRLSEDTVDFVRARLPKVYSRELVEVIFEQPYCRISDVVEAGVVGRQAAARYLKALASIGVFREKKVGRELLFIHSRLLDLLSSDTHQVSPYE